MDAGNFSIRYNANFYPNNYGFQRPNHNVHGSEHPNRPSFNPQNLQNLINLLQKLLAALQQNQPKTDRPNHHPHTNNAHHQATTPSNDSSTEAAPADYLTKAPSNGIAAHDNGELHQHQIPGRASPLVSHVGSDKKIQIQTPEGTKTFSPGTEYFVNADKSEQLANLLGVTSKAAFTTTLFDNDKDGKISQGDAVYMNDNQTGEQLAEHLVTSDDVKRLG